MNVRLTKTHNMVGIKALVTQDSDLLYDAPEKVATDDLESCLRAIKEVLSEDFEHEVRPCTTNPMEQSHWRIKHRYYPTLGFG